MERRVLIAFVVSAVIFAVWSLLFPPAAPQQTRPGLTEGERPAPAVDRENEDLRGVTGGERETDERAAVDAVTGTEERTVELSDERVAVTVTNRGAAVASYRLLGYEDDVGNPVDLVQTVDLPDRALPLQLLTEEGPDDRLYAIQEEGERGVTLRWSDGQGSYVQKRFELDPETFGLDVEVEAAGRLAESRLAVGTGLRDMSAEERNSRLALWGEVVVFADGEIERYRRKKVNEPRRLVPSSVAFVGFEDSYFLSLLRPRSAVEDIELTPLTVMVGDVAEPGAEAEEAEEVSVVRVAVGLVDGRFSGEILGAPKRYDLLQRIGGGVERVLDFGIFGPISVLFLKVLRWIYGHVGNYGVAIILLTVGIRLILFPLMHTSTVSMRKMQRVQPKVKEIQARYKKKKGDTQARAKMNQEVMALYKEEGVNPMGGCLPLLVQMPILWALYKLFLNSIELRHAPFMLWIDDLSIKDPYLITPILMTATMWLQQRLAPQAGDPQQQRIMRMMPLIFGIMFLQFPAGLVLYWLTNNVLSIVQQEITLRMIGERGRNGRPPKGARK